MRIKTLLPGSQIVCWLIFATGCMFLPVASADMVSTAQLIQEAQSASVKGEIMEVLSRHDVRAGLADMGVDLNETENRVNSMTQAELNRTLAGLNSLPAGGGVAGTILTILLIILILDIAGVTDIFPGI